MKCGFKKLTLSDLPIDLVYYIGTLTEDVGSYGNWGKLNKSFYRLLDPKKWYRKKAINYFASFLSFLID